AIQCDAAPASGTFQASSDDRMLRERRGRRVPPLDVESHRLDDALNSVEAPHGFAEKAGIARVLALGSTPDQVAQEAKDCFALGFDVVDNSLMHRGRLHYHLSATQLSRLEQ